MKANKECAIQTLAEFNDHKFEEISKEGKSLEQVEAERPEVKQIFEEQTLGTKPINVPVYHYHGLEDEVRAGWLRTPNCTTSGANSA